MLWEAGAYTTYTLYLDRIKMNNILVGSDPELALFDSKLNRYVSAIPYFKGTKHAPEIVGEIQLSHDNVNVEFGIVPAAGLSEWLGRTREAIRQIKTRLPEHVTPVCRAYTEYCAEELNHPEAREFACDPDFNAYTMDINKVPEGSANLPFRSAGGHIHIGEESIASSIPKQIELIKLLDITAGIFSLALDKDESSRERRKLYGNPGAFRPKPYGVEYRTLGNFWVSSPKLAEFFYSVSRYITELHIMEGVSKVSIGNINSLFISSTREEMIDFVTAKIVNLKLDSLAQLFNECVKEEVSPNLYSAWEV